MHPPVASGILTGKITVDAAIPHIIRHARVGIVTDGKLEWLDPLAGSSTLNPVVSTFGHGQAHTRRITLTSNDVILDWQLIQYPQQPWFTIRAKITNQGETPLRLDRIILLQFTADDVGFAAPWQQWRALLGAGAESALLGEKLKSNGTLESATLTALLDPASESSLVLGFSCTAAFGQVEIRAIADQITIAAVSLEDGVRLAPGESRWSEQLHVGRQALREGLEQYAHSTGAQARATGDAPSLAGWCSWYYYHPFADRDITEDLLIECLDFLRHRKQDLPLQLFLLDDGYQSLPGDWTTLRPLFPHGMKWLVEQINAAEMIPGLWISPFIAHRDSQLLASHPDWVLLNEHGKAAEIMGNWGEETYAIDVTRPDVLEWISNLFRIVRHEWGFRYVKVDFNTMPAAGGYSDTSVTRFQAARHVYEIIRQVMGEDAYIATCTGAPYPPSVGIADICRTSSDVEPNWHTIKAIAQSNLLRWMFHRRWWVGDPDCLVLRTLDSQLSEPEVRVLVTMLAMCGGLTCGSDPLPTLPPHRLRLFQQIIPSCGQAARPLDLGQGPIPCLMCLQTDGVLGPVAILAAFNWDDEPRDIVIDTTDLGFGPDVRCHFFDLWSDTYHGSIAGRHRLRSQPAHSCQLLAVRPERPGEIQLISTSLHYTQGAAEVVAVSRQMTAPFSRDSCKAELMLTLAPTAVREGKLIFAAGDGLVLAACQGARSELARREDGLFEVNLCDMTEHVALLLRWRCSDPNAAAAAGPTDERPL